MENVKHEQQREKFPKGENQNKEAFRRWLIREISSGRMTILSVFGVSSEPAKELNKLKLAA
jgi:hypothetical protein